MFILSGIWALVVAGMVLGHWLVPERLRGWWIAGGSAAFLGFMNPLSLASYDKVLVTSGAVKLIEERLQ